MFFHGSEHKIKKFTDDFVGGREAVDQEGPGIYFTSSWKNARSYGPYVYTVRLRPKKEVSTENGKKAPLREIEWLIQQAPEWESIAQNWNENSAIGLRMAAKDILQYNENPHQQFLQVWIDFFKYNPLEYVRGMTKLGYDIIYIKELESIIAGENNITHAVVLNPAIIEFIDMEDDRTEEEKAKDQLNEIRKFVRKTLNENNSNKLNDNFWKWFAGSKAVDASGNPLVVHHGTSKKFSVFSLKNAPQKIIWFTSNKSSIESGDVGAAGKGHIMDLYVSIKNPAGWDEYEKYGLGQLRDLGYDGAILPDPDGSITGFVFDSNQLKSVKNKGGWDMSQKNIYKEVEKFDSGKFPVPEYKPGELKSKFSDDYDLSKHNFNHGDCDIYAVALHRLYGYPLYVVRGWFLEPEWGGEREWDYEDSHIVVKLPNGNYMDSNGETTEMELRQNCAFSNDIAKITFEPLSEADALATFSCQDQEADVKQIMKYINSKNIQEVRGPSKYVNCHLSDLIRMDKIEEFLNEIEKNPEYNTEEPEYDWLMDPHGGYPEQTYIQNKLENGEIVFWEGWSSYCWKGLYSKPEYKGLSKENALKKIFRERTPRIAQEFDMTIKDADFFWHDAGDDDAENGYIMKIVFRLK